MEHGSAYSKTDRRVETEAGASTSEHLKGNGLKSGRAATQLVFNLHKTFMFVTYADTFTTCSLHTPAIPSKEDRLEADIVYT